METIDSVDAMSAAAARFRDRGLRVGFVPTMGYLHRGHASLIALARGRADVVVVSVFVNPAQFAPGEDFESYPRDAAGDAVTAAEAGASVMFTPPAAGIYPPGFDTFIDPGKIATILEGRSRPGHFRGVATVVAKLLNVVRPHVAVFGQKDAQQGVIVARMVRDLNMDTEILVAPTVREKDGLACSSRNVYLSISERAESTALYRSLMEARDRIAVGERDPEKIKRSMREIITAQPSAVIDYVSIADAGDLREVDGLRAGSKVLVSLAVRIGKTRLIDNDIITVH